jgi:hypothetical protein
MTGSLSDNLLERIRTKAAVALLGGTEINYEKPADSRPPDRDLN